MSGKPRMSGARAALDYFHVPDDEDEHRLVEYARRKQEMVVRLIEAGTLSVAAAIGAFRTSGHLARGDAILLNDPFRGGTHLPDITLVTPVFVSDPPSEVEAPFGFVACRAHHADVGGMTADRCRSRAKSTRKA